MFNTINDIMNYWRKGPEEESINIGSQRINKPDIELILKRIIEKDKEGVVDIGVLLISFSNSGVLNPCVKNSLFKVFNTAFMSSFSINCLP